MASLTSLIRKPKRVITTGRAALAGGIAAGAGAAVGILLRRRQSDGAAQAAEGAGAPPAPPSVANYDAARPPTGGVSSEPVVDASAEPLGIDELAEEEAAAAEAGAIGGPEIDYARSEPDMNAGDAPAAVFEEPDADEGR